VVPFGWQFDDALDRLAAAVPAEAGPLERPTASRSWT
jgi:hypothetical protein